MGIKILAVAVGLLLSGCAGPHINCYLPAGAEPVPFQTILDGIPPDLPRAQSYNRDGIPALVDKAYPDWSPDDRLQQSIALSFGDGFYCSRTRRIFISEDSQHYDYTLIHELAHATGPDLGREAFTLPEGASLPRKLLARTREELTAELTTYIVYSEAGLDKPYGNVYIRHHLSYADPGPIGSHYPAAEAAAAVLLGREPRVQCDIREDMVRQGYLRWWSWPVWFVWSIFSDYQ